MEGSRGLRLSPSACENTDMYSACIVCRASFPETGELEHLRRGDRVAFDLAKGRLWLICRSCRRWSLVPLEDRWEILEELEVVCSGKARVLSRTPNITLLRKGSLEIVRVGGADLAEEAWWRFGRQIPARSPFASWSSPLFRKLRFGTNAWVGEVPCRVCGFVFREISFADRKILMVRPEEAGFSLRRRCPRCKEAEDGGLHLGGIEAELALARIMAFQNDLGVSRVTIHAATRLLQDPEGPEDLVRILSQHGKPLGDLPPIGLTAMEITVSAAREKTFLKMEAQALQARWRREEELAAIIDGDLSPVARLEGLVRRLRGSE